jgi:hypothetical protein
MLHRSVELTEVERTFVRRAVTAAFEHGLDPKATSAKPQSRSAACPCYRLRPSPVAPKLDSEQFRLAQGLAGCPMAC